jgi:CDP-glycerol glycerophosphotransferase (TagB/SpsB family)
VNILFPLQYRPEASTSVLARYFGDDLELIKNIAFSLPARAVLYVKEHVSAVGLRDADFYREIASYPNVRVLHPDYPLAERLAGFDAVITLASTVGFEALQLGIPVLLLGRVFYGDRPGVTRVESFRQLDELVGSLTPNVATPSDAALNWYRSFCFPGSFNYLDPAALTDANIDKLAAPLLRMHARHAAS